jgi:hypothetical protein
VRRADDGAHVEDLRIALAVREVSLGSAVVERDSRRFDREDGATKRAEALVERDSNQGTSGRNRGTRAVKPTARGFGASERRGNRGEIGWNQGKLVGKVLARGSVAREDGENRGEIGWNRGEHG